MDSSDGILAPKMDFGSARGKDGSLYFGSREGILRFEPTILYDNNIPPPLYFNEVKVMDQPVRISDYMGEGRILELPGIKTISPLNLSLWILPLPRVISIVIKWRDWIRTG